MKAQVVVLALFAGASSAFAQGSLTPPGAPGQTMKSLAQIEPRTVIPGGTTSYNIAAPGSYVLGGNLTIAEGTAIVFNSGNATLDLNGFTISSTPDSPYGRAITLAPNISNIRITNGHIAGSTTYASATHTFAASGFEYGIAAEGSLTNAEIDHISVSGMKLIGINAPEAMIHHCSVTLCADDGIVGARVSDSRVTFVGGSGIIGSVVSDCSATSVGQAVDAHGISGMSIQRSYGTADSGSGINATQIVEGCVGSSVSANGIYAITVNGSNGISTSGNGIRGSVISYSYGRSTNGTAISAIHSAIGCSVGTGGTVSAPNKLLGTP